MKNTSGEKGGSDVRRNGRLTCAVRREARESPCSSQVSTSIISLLLLLSLPSVNVVPPANSWPTDVVPPPGCAMLDDTEDEERRRAARTPFLWESECCGQRRDRVHILPVCSAWKNKPFISNSDQRGINLKCTRDDTAHCGKALLPFRDGCCINNSTDAGKSGRFRCRRRIYSFRKTYKNEKILKRDSWRMVKENKPTEHGWRLSHCGEVLELSGGSGCIMHSIRPAVAAAVRAVFPFLPSRWILVLLMPSTAVLVPSRSRPATGSSVSSVTGSSTPATAVTTESHSPAVPVGTPVVIVYVVVAHQIGLKRPA